MRFLKYYRRMTFCMYKALNTRFFLKNLSLGIHTSVHCTLLYFENPVVYRCDPVVIDNQKVFWLRLFTFKDEQKSRWLLRYKGGRTYRTKPHANIKFFLKKKLGFFKHQHTSYSSIPFKVGSVIKVIDYLRIKEHVIVRSKKKGKGTMGVMKRYNYAGGNASHGTSLSHWKKGATGAGTANLAWIFPFTKMAGRSKWKFVTIFGLKILQIVDQDLCKYIVLNGPIPGTIRWTMTYISKIY